MEYQTLIKSEIYPDNNNEFENVRDYYKKDILDRNFVSEIQQDIFKEDYIRIKFVLDSIYDKDEVLKEIMNGINNVEGEIEYFDECISETKPSKNRRFEYI